MKSSFLLIIAVLFASTAMAQSVIVVDSERIFKSLEAYNSALAQVDSLSKRAQQEVDDKFTAVANAFNEYAAVKATYTATQRSIAEAGILSMESEATKLQEGYFGKEGEIMKRRLELIAPIQTRVFAAIEEYANENGVDLVLDEASNPSILFSGEKADRTDAIIEALR